MRVLLVLTCALCVSGASEVLAQETGRAREPPDQVVVAGLNVVLAGLSAGVLGHLSGKGFTRSVLGGSVGGGVAYLGRRVAVEDFDGAGFLGRGIGALGASISRSAAFGSGPLDTLVLPLGPIRGYVAFADRTRLSVRVDAEHLAVLLYASTRGHYRFSLGRSLSAGAPVFVSSRGLRGAGDNARGAAVGGLIVLRADAPEDMSAAFRHERVHLLQHDYAKAYVGLPYEHWLGQQLGLSDTSLGRVFDLGIGHYPLLIVGSPLLEVEARRLAPHTARE